MKVINYHKIMRFVLLKPSRNSKGNYLMNRFGSIYLSGLFVSVILTLILSSCDNPEIPPVIIEEEKGKVAFYTNAHDYLSCDPSLVCIYMDSVLVGTLKKSGLGDSLDSSGNNDSLLIIEKPVGTYEYTAKVDCVDSIEWKGTIEVLKDTTIQIPLNVMDVVDELTKVKFSLIGTWKIYPGSEWLNVIFSRKDTVLEIEFGSLSSAGSFKVISKDSIEANRPTVDPLRHPRITKHKIIFTGKDTLLLKYFSRNTASTFGHASLNLTRKK